MNVRRLADSNSGDVGQLRGSLEDFCAPVRDLLADCVAGERQAWSKLHREYYPVAIGFLRKLGVPQAQVEDVCQEVFLQIFRYLPRFRGDAELTTWIYRICISEARRFRRKEKVARLARTLLGREHPPEPSTGLDFNEASAADRVLRALNQLPTRRRTILVLFDLEGLPGNQIAQIVGCSAISVRRELHYARTAFSELLERAVLESSQ